MEHLIPPKHPRHRVHTHPRTRHYEKSSGVISVLLTLAHPLFALLCLKVADVLALGITSFLTQFALLYGPTGSLAKQQIDSIAQYNWWYQMFLVLAVGFVASSAGFFRFFRFKNFWLNFVISLFLLLLSILVLQSGVRLYNY